MKPKDFEHLPYSEYQAELQKIRFTTQDLINAIVESESLYACISLNDFTNIIKLTANTDENHGIIINNDAKSLMTRHYATYNNVKIYVDKNIDLGEMKFSNDENDFIRKTK